MIDFTLYPFPLQSEGDTNIPKKWTFANDYKFSKKKKKTDMKTSSLNLFFQKSVNTVGKSNCYC